MVSRPLWFLLRSTLRCDQRISFWVVEVWLMMVQPFIIPALYRPYPLGYPEVKLRALVLGRDIFECIASDSVLATLDLPDSIFVQFFLYEDGQNAIRHRRFSGSTQKIPRAVEIVVAQMRPSRRQRNKTGGPRSLPLSLFSSSGLAVDMIILIFNFPLYLQYRALTSSLSVIAFGR